VSVWGGIMFRTVQASQSWPLAGVWEMVGQWFGSRRSMNDSFTGLEVEES